MGERVGKLDISPKLAERLSACNSYIRDYEAFKRGERAVEPSMDGIVGIPARTVIWDQRRFLDWRYQDGAGAGGLWEQRTEEAWTIYQIVENQMRSRIRKLGRVLSYLR